MKISKQIGVLTLALVATTTQAWDGSNRHVSNSSVNSDMSGGFGFNMSFSGRTQTNVSSVPRPVILRGVHFKYDSANLTAASKKNLDKVATVLKNHAGNKLDVGGHASAEGDAMYNLALSTRRARAVRNYLIEQGVTPVRLTSTGYGEMRPIANNVTEQGRSVNRRVELAPVTTAL